MISFWKLLLLASSTSPFTRGLEHFTYSAFARPFSVKLNWQLPHNTPRGYQDNSQKALYPCPRTAVTGYRPANLAPERRNTRHAKLLVVSPSPFCSTRQRQPITAATASNNTTRFCSFGRFSAAFLNRHHVAIQVQTPRADESAGRRSFVPAALRKFLLLQPATAHLQPARRSSCLRSGRVS